MGRRSRHKDPGEILLETATRLFCREGISNTGINRILTESGVARKTLYERFGSKENLLMAVLQRDGETWLKWFVERIHTHPGSPSERLLGVFDILAEWFSREDFYGCTFINSVAEHDKLSLQFRSLADQHRDSIRAILLRLAIDAQLNNPEEIADQFNLLIDGATIAAMLYRTPDCAMQAKCIGKAILAFSAKNQRQSCTPETNSIAQHTGTHSYARDESSISGGHLTR